MVNAAVATEPGRTSLEKFPLPEVTASSGLMRVEAVGMCGSDWSRYQGHDDQISFPVILGHECIGIVEAVGDEAAARWGVAPGDRIALEEPLPCRQCRMCRSVNYHLCTNKAGKYGAMSVNVPPALWGGFSEYMFLHENSLVYKLSPEAPAEAATFFIPLSNGIRWVQEVGGVGVGDTVVIQGPGPHGLGCVAAARLAGARHIIVIGLAKDQGRLEAARILGATETIRGDVEDSVGIVNEITGGSLADVVLDITPNAPEALVTAIRLVRPGGTIVLAGIKHVGIADFPSDSIFRKEITLRGVVGRDFRSVEPALRLIEDEVLPFGRLCSHVFGLAATHEALTTFSRVTNTDREVVHVVVEPWR